MRIRIRAEGCRLFLPVPAPLLGLALRCVPDRALEGLRARAPEPCGGLLTRENLRLLLGECLAVVRENRGLEIVHVEASDGTFVSVKL